MHDESWERLLTALGGTLPPQALDTWVRPGRVLVHRDDRLEIGVPSQFIRGYLVEHYMNDLQGAATLCFGPGVRLTISVAPADGVEEVGLAEPHAAIDKDGIIRAGGGLRHRQTGGPSELIR